MEEREPIQKTINCYFKIMPSIWYSFLKDSFPKVFLYCFIAALAAALEAFFLLTLKDIASSLQISHVKENISKLGFTVFPEHWTPIHVGLLGVLAIFFRTSLLVWGNRYTATIVQNWIRKKRNTLNQQIQNSNFPLYRPHFQQEWVYIHREGHNFIKQGLFAKLQSLFSLLQIAFLVPLVFLFSWKLALGIMFLLLPTWILAKLRIRILKNMGNRWHHAQSFMHSFIQRYGSFLEYFNGNPLKEQGHLKREWHEYETQEFQWETSNRSFGPIMEWMYLLLIAALLLLIHHVSQDILNLNAQFVPFMVLILMLYKPIKEWSKHVPEHQLGQKSWIQWNRFSEEVQRFPQRNKSFTIKEREVSIYPYIETSNISFTYGKDTLYFPIRNLSVRIPLYDYTLIHGENGVGKTTLVRILVQIETPQEGSFLIPPNWSQYYTYLPQNPFIPPSFSKNSRDFLYKAPKDWKKLADILEITSLLQTIPKQFDWEWFSKLSGGEKQRCCLFHTFIQSTPFLILDEPTAWLPSSVRISLLQELQQFWKDRWGNTGGWLLISHEAGANTLCPHSISLEKEIVLDP
jgi:ABC-type multidrug transport system fused ATPase/permease subunit